jgi:hypothetical protein
MRTGRRSELPRDLLRAQRRFQAWRARHAARRRLPQFLWDLAVRLLQRHSLCRIATALKLDYYSLKKRAQQNAASASSSDLTFVEVPAAPAPAVPGKQCFCDLHHRDGNSMRLQLVGYDAADLEGLARCFWNAR